MIDQAKLDQINVTLMDRVFVPTMIKTARDAGLVIRTDADVENFVKAATYVEQKEAEALTQDNTLLKAAATALSGGKPGTDVQSNQRETARLAKMAAEDADVRQAILELRTMA